MKNYLLLIVILIVTPVFAQKDFQGMVVYESKTSTEGFKMPVNQNMTPEIQKRIEDRMKKLSEKTFMLYFDRTASIYEEEEKLDAPGGNAGMGGGRMISSFLGGGGKLYKNVKSKTFAIDKEMMGKEFLITDSLPTMKWKMESESKKIGNYTCFKATCVIPASKSDFRNMRPKETTDSKTDKPKSTNWMDRMEMPKDVEVVAWYTPEIPINQGPEKFWGLPGLILEVVNGKTTILCSKVVMNNKEKKEIVAPTKGKVVTQAEYDEITVAKMKEMSEMYQGRGAQGGGGFQIRTGRN